MRKPRRSVFLGAAKRLSRFREGISTFAYPEQTSQFCCDCIQYETEARPNLKGYSDEPEMEMFREWFYPSDKEWRNQKCEDDFGLGWWDTASGGKEKNGHDYESRLLALLLCWAMLEPKKKRKHS